VGFAHEEDLLLRHGCFGCMLFGFWLGFRMCSSFMYVFEIQLLLIFAHSGAF
jgi:hypothetical protein